MHGCVNINQFVTGLGLCISTLIESNSALTFIVITWLCSLDEYPPPTCSTTTLFPSAPLIARNTYSLIRVYYSDKTTSGLETRSSRQLYIAIQFIIPREE